MRIRLTEELWREGNMYVAYCPELDVPSCGETIEKAKNNLKEVIMIHLMETFPWKFLDNKTKYGSNKGHTITGSQGDDR